MMKTLLTARRTAFAQLSRHRFVILNAADAGYGRLSKKTALEKMNQRPSMICLGVEHKAKDRWS